MPESHGGVVASGGARFLLREPTNHFGGLAWTFAKTVAQPGETPEETAVRAVREKTGCDAIVRLRLPGVFTGSGGQSTYFLMEALPYRQPPNWQTAALCWVPYDEAAQLISRSINAAGRQRDLAVLTAANEAINALTLDEHLIVQPEDWFDLQPMPEQQVRLHPALQFSAVEMQRIVRGFVMYDMDAKWFIHFDGARLKLYRSWTGILVFDAGLAFDEQRSARVTNLLVNRDRAQYGGHDDTEDIRLFREVIRVHLIEPSIRT